MNDVLVNEIYLFVASDKMLQFSWNMLLCNYLLTEVHRDCKMPFFVKFIQFLSSDQTS